MLRKEFISGIRQLVDFNLTYDILIFERHLPATISLVEMFPDQKFVLDHIAKPRIKDHIYDPWTENIKKLGQFPNVYCKISGMVTENDWANWHEEDFTPYMDIVFEAFGTERIMIGSDWPVCTLAASYTQVINIYQKYIESFSLDEKQAVLGKNAVEFYGLV
jgi:L-fuconolactonase